MIIQYETLDASYDYEAIYVHLHRLKAKALIAYNKQNEGELLGFDEHSPKHAYENIHTDMTAWMKHTKH
ncbi:hypothetical protein ACWOMK_28980 [Bacillus thuringiensis]|uniref:hypothetical protein n=1 Tax=Bacillus tropicus TaxID=2026188 RepID=UPI0035DF48F3